MMLNQTYLIFVISFTQTGFSKTKFYTQKTTKGTKNTKNVSEKVKYMHFFHSIWKNLHLTENFYTDIIHVCGVCDKYEVCHQHPHHHPLITIIFADKHFHLHLLAEQRRGRESRGEQSGENLLQVTSLCILYSVLRITYYVLSVLSVLENCEERTSHR